MRTLVLAFFIATVNCHAAEVPSVAKPGEGALLSAGLIYPLEGRATPQCHASTIVQTTKGGPCRRMVCRHA